MRLAKYLAEAGVASRRKAEVIIRAGQIQVNGETVTDPAVKVDPSRDKIETGHGPVKPVCRKVYILLNKPQGYISAVSDPFSRPTVMDLIREEVPGLHPVGRLDLDAKGLLLLTNDGEFTNLMIHPRYETEKIYQVTVKGSITGESLARLAGGVELEDKITTAAEVKVLQRLRKNTVIEIRIHEGRKRQIKRMCAAVGFPVIDLTRTGYGFLDLSGVAPGSYRYLSGEEVSLLMQNAKCRMQN